MARGDRPPGGAGPPGRDRHRARRATRLQAGGRMDRELTSTSRVRVRPRHCDAQAMVHAARYYEFFEDDFLDWLDVHAGGYRQLRERTGVDLVIVTSGCEYR